MPTYVYETLPAAGEAPKRFEFVQRMSDAPYTTHPETGVPLRRVFTAPFIIGGRGGEPRKEAPAAADAGAGTAEAAEAPAAAETAPTHVCDNCSH